MKYPRDEEETAAFERLRTDRVFLLHERMIEILPEIGCEAFAVLAFIWFWMERRSRVPAEQTIAIHTGVPVEVVRAAQRKLGPYIQRREFTVGR